MNDKQLTSGRDFLERIFQKEKDREPERKERELERKKNNEVPIMEDSPQSRLCIARYNYSTAFLLYYTLGYQDRGYPVSDDVSYKTSIGLLDKALDLVPDFSDASLLREEIWHSFLTSWNRGDKVKELYHLYLNSAAWYKKREQRMSIDGDVCACGAPAVHVHHKTYENIGKELMSDLVSLCEKCHTHVHENSLYLKRLVLPGSIGEDDDGPMDDTKEPTINVFGPPFGG